MTLKNTDSEQNLLSLLLQDYQQRIEEKIKQELFLLGSNDQLREACEYALLNGGKRFRPALVYMIADALGNDVDVSPAALAIEYFHTASLVADDLPCMDNDDERRNKPSVHKVFGETVALLVSFALIAAGYGCIAVCAEHTNLPNRHLLGTMALENVSYNTGLQGATGGQFLDIFPPNLTIETLREAIHKKTISLFEISFVFGWLFGGGALESLPLVKQAAAHFGMAFQIADDLNDLEQDAKNDRKVNIAAVFGNESARKMFGEEIKGYRSALEALHLESRALLGLAKALEEGIKVI